MLDRNTVEVLELALRHAGLGRLPLGDFAKAVRLLHSFTSTGKWRQAHEQLEEHDYLSRVVADALDQSALAKTVANLVALLEQKLTEQPQPTERAGRDQAAAVCYRVHQGGLEFLLVRTSSKERWTLPKGKIEDGETSAIAAAREAREECGAVGQVDERPLTYYLHPRQRSGKQRLVAAHLLRVETLRNAERGRNPTWYPAEAAIHALHIGRAEGELRRELEGVIRLAVARINEDSPSSPVEG